MSCSDELFSIKQGALLPSPVLELDVDDSVDLSTADHINFVWRPKGEAGTRNVVAMSLVDAVARLVQVDLTTPMVATVGAYEFQVEVVYGSKVLVIPDDDFYLYRVTPTI